MPTDDVLKGKKVWCGASADKCRAGWAEVHQGGPGVVRLCLDDRTTVEATVAQARSFAAEIMDIARRAENAE